MNAFTDEMACLYVGISTTTLYRYCEENPEFRERKELLKRSPDLQAQKTLVGDLSNTHGARWWAEHRMPEFMPKAKVELGGRLDIQDVTGSEEAKRIKEEYEEKLKDAIIQSHKHIKNNE